MSADTETLVEAWCAPIHLRWSRLPWATTPLDGQAFAGVDLKPAVGGLASLALASA